MSRPASLSSMQKSALCASRIPLVAIWHLLNPSDLAWQMAAGRVGATVGSPPVNCTDAWRRGRTEAAASSICLISSMVGS